MSLKNTMLNGYPIEHTSSTANVIVTVGGQEVKLYVRLSSDSPLTMQTHVFGYDCLPLNKDGLDIQTIAYRLSCRSGKQYPLYDAPIPHENWISFQVEQDNGERYEKNFEKWIPKIERKLNDLICNDYKSGPNFKVKNNTIMIVGLGGTGSRIAELIDKTPHKKIILIDNDVIVAKNLYRLNASQDWLNEYKVDFTKSQMYFNNIETHNIKIQDYLLENTLDDIDFAFLAIDNKETREFLKKELKAKSIKYVDASIGVDINDEQEFIFSSRTSTEKDNSPIIYESDEYRKNIQIAEVNALNAAQAVIHYKTIMNFYRSWDDDLNKVEISNNFELSKGGN